MNPNRVVHKKQRTQILEACEGDPNVIDLKLVEINLEKTIVGRVIIIN